ncbi:MAG: PulJ/GspJ family protein [Planctomycetota bacterium]|jgi:prepilin-type N-terminal cleavage/methylation domain-containing protein
MRNSRTKRGFTVVELMLALAIGAMLLAAVATAFNASAKNYHENEEIFKTINNARQALLRMTNQLRTAEGVDPNSPVNECSFLTSALEDITYQYRSTDKKLYLITKSDGKEYVLCDNVVAMTFNKTTELNDDGTLWVCKSVQIYMTVEYGDLQRAVSSSVVIRRNLN